MTTVRPPCREDDPSHFKVRTRERVAVADVAADVVVVDDVVVAVDGQTVQLKFRISDLEEI